MILQRLLPGKCSNEPRGEHRGRTSKGVFRDSAQMSLDGNAGIITSEAALFLKNAHMSLEGNIRGYTSEATSGQMSITSELSSSVEESSGCNISEATSGQNAHNIRAAIERGGEQRRKSFIRFFWAYAHANVWGGSNPASVGDFSEC